MTAAALRHEPGSPSNFFNDPAMLQRLLDGLRNLPSPEPEPAPEVPPRGAGHRWLPGFFARQRHAVALPITTVQRFKGQTLTWSLCGVLVSMPIHQLDGAGRLQCSKCAELLAHNTDELGAHT
jgi:hypothetical protein